MARKKSDPRFYSYSFTYFLKYEPLEIFVDLNDEEVSINFELKKLNMFFEERKNIFKFVSYQLEKCPNTGKLHVQGFLYLFNAKSFASVKKMFKIDYNSMHLESNRGSIQECYDYTRKLDSRYLPNYASEGILYEMGALPSLSEVNQQGQRTDLEDFLDAIYDGTSYDDLLLNFPTMMIKYEKFYEKHRKRYLEKIYMTKYRTMKNELYLGVIDMDSKIQDIYDKYGFENVYRLPSYNKYAFDDYEQQEVVLLDNYKEQFYDMFLSRLLSGAPLYLGARYESKVAAFTKVIVLTEYDKSIFSVENRIVDLKQLFYKIKE